MPAVRRPATSTRKPSSRRARRVGTVLLVGLLGVLLSAPAAFAEGSADINIGPETALRNRPVVNAGTAGPDHNGYTVLRAYARAGETIDMGSSAMGLGGIADIRVYPPGTGFSSATEPGMRASFPGDAVFATAQFSCDADDPGTGRIGGRVEELAGPLPNPGGYAPCRYVAPVDGIYSILMLAFSEGGLPSGTSTVGSPNSSTTQGPTISMWDLTVRDALGTEQPGRVFTNAFEFLIPTAAAAASNLSTFAYTPAGYIYHVTIFNPRAKAWDLAVNGSGVVDATTGEPISASFRWGPNAGYPPTLEPTYGQAVAPQMWEGDRADDSRYPMFLTTPDPIVVSGPGGLGETRGYSATPMAPEGGLAPLLSFTGAGGEAGATVQGTGGTIAIDAPQLRSADYDLTLDLDRNGTFGGGRDVELEGTLAGSGATAVGWGGRDSTGAVVPCGVSYPYRVTSTLPAMHVIQSDTQSEAGTQIERLSLPADPLLGGPLAASYDDIDPYKATAVTNAAPSAVSEGTSGPTFHGWSANSGHAVFTDTWASGHPVDGSGTFEVSCPIVSTPPPGGTTPPGGTLPPDGTSPSGTASPSGAPAAGPPSSPEGPRRTPKKHKHHEHHPKAKLPSLSLTLTAGTTRARPTSVIGYRLTVTNTGGSAAREVVVCDDVPPGQKVLRTVPTAEGADEPCWTVGVLAAGDRRVFRLNAMVEPLAGSGAQRDSATASAANVKGVRRDRVAIGIKPLPATACGSELARPTGSSVAFRC